MTGILTPTSGRVLVDGIEPYKNRQLNAKKIGVVFGQRTQLWWDLPLNESFSLLKETVTLLVSEKYASLYFYYTTYREVLCPPDRFWAPIFQFFPIPPVPSIHPVYC